MASAGRFMRNAQRFSKQFGSSVKSKNGQFSTAATGNLKKAARSSASGNIFGGKTLLSAVTRQVSKMELQNSVAVMSLSSKVSACMDICATSDGEVTEGSEDSDDVCSQPGHSKRKNR